MQNPFDKYKVLVVGCGGTGTEIIKLLVAMKIKPTIIDFDVVESSNLNRQFYFTIKDKNEYKAKVIANKIKCDYKIIKIEEITTDFINNFDIIFSCLDSISSRMELNYLFFNSFSKILIDTGIEGTKFHIKKVTKDTSCLYCIKHLYNTDNTPFLCSIANSNFNISFETRDKVLKTIVFKIVNTSEYIRSLDKKTFYVKIVESFNQKAPKNLFTTIFEVQGIAENIMPSISYINSICASYAVITAFSKRKEDFWYSDGEVELIKDKPLVEGLILEKNKECFVCKKK